MKKKDIVKSQQDFNKVIKNGKKISNNGFVIYYKDNKKSTRYGISVGTKLGNAVFRNKYKRKIRMIITNNIEILKETKKDYIILLRKSGIDLSYQQLETKFIELAKKIKEN